MLRKKGRKKLFTAIAVIVAVLLVGVGLMVFKSAQPSKSSDSKEKSTSGTLPITDDGGSAEKPAVNESEQAVPETVADPAMVSTVAIEPMAITVSYTKGVGGFDFQVLRSPSGTKYVELSSEGLVGTKCTDDQGQFASIIEKPTKDENATLAKTTTVDGTEYGLSLADETCTSDAGLLKQYQTAFSDAFSLLKKI